MARRASKLTSISDAAAHRFISEAGLRHVLTCQQVPGFSLIRLSRGGSWRWRYTAADGKRRNVTVGTYPAMKPSQAVERVLEWMNQSVDPLVEKEATRQTARRIARESELRTLRVYLERYYRPHMERSWKSDNAKSTYNRIRSSFEFLLDRDMASVSRADINSWQIDREGRGTAYATIRRNYSALKTLLRHAVNEEVLQEDPLANHKLLAPSREDQTKIQSDLGKSERRMLSNPEVVGLFKGLNAFGEDLRAQRRNSRSHGKSNLVDLDRVDISCVHWFIPFCHLAIYTGLRPGDLYTLTWEELNIPFTRLTKICEKTSHAIRRDKKPAVVDMRLNPSLMEVLRKWHEHNGRPVTGLVFPSPVTGRQLDRSAHRKPWGHVKELGGLNETLNFYALRHHFISAMLAKGTPVFTVAKLVGHKSVEMILQHYGHLCPDQAVEALDVVAQSLENNCKKVS